MEGDFFMLKKRDTQECNILFELMMHPEVFPFVRDKAYTQDEFVFLTKKTIELEESGQLISRTILDEWETPIGTINLYDIKDHAGFLGTWLGKPYHGKGYNQPAKEEFFKELFYEHGIETIYMRIRVENIRSQKAAEKLPYVLKANDTKPQLFKEINPTEHIYHLYEIPKDLFTLYLLRSNKLDNQMSLQA